jgi:hypothetical protein
MTDRVLSIIKERWLPYAAAGIAFIVYRLTMAPGLMYIDSGELAAVAYTLGIAHPSGYPLFTLLGWFVAHLPFGGEVIVRLNTMAALFCAAGVFVFYHLVLFLLHRLAEVRGKRGAHRAEDARVVAPFAAFGASLVLGFSETWWSQAVSVEVYALHILLVVTTMYLFLRALHAKEAAWWWSFAFVLGLAFTNHMTTILLAPGFLYLFFATQGWARSAWRKIVRLFVPFALGLSVYLYLPIRAAQGPALSWGNPVTWERFVWHLSGKQYRVWLFSSTEATGRQFRYFFQSLPDEFAYAGLILAVLGMIVLFRLHKKFWIWSTLLFIACVLYSINYDIHDIDSYFLLAYLVVAFWAGVGLWWMGAWLVREWAWNRVAVLLMLGVMGFLPLGAHYTRVDLHATHDVDDYTRNMFASFDQHALVFSYQWDFWVSASQYYQHVRGERTDVTVIDKELLRRSWYLAQLERTAPWLIAATRVQVDAFLRELTKFEHDLPYDPNVIQARFVEMIQAFIRVGGLTRPVYVTVEVEPEFTVGYQRVPQGLAFRLFADSAFHPTAFPEFQTRPIHGSGRLESQMRVLYGGAFSARGEYYFARGERNEALRCYEEALKHDPTSTLANARRQMLERFR